MEGSKNQHKRVQELEIELREYQYNSSILRYDINGDGTIDGRDATVILSIYALNSTGADIRTMEEYNELIMSKEKNISE